MDELLTIAISNTVFAGFIAIFAFALTRVWKNPHVAHMLWLLVLLKLVTPPIIQIPLPTIAQSEKPRATFMIDRPPSQHIVYPSQTPSGAFAASLEPVGANPKTNELAGSRVTLPDWQATLGWQFWLLASWAIGIIVVVYVAWRRHVRLVQILVEARSPDASLVADMAAIAAKLGISTCPQLLLTPARISPLVTCGIWKQTVLLPIELIGDMERHQVQSVLAHELAHLKRRDHWTRLFEVFVLAVYWWNPLAWLASRQAGQAEEVCCDSWVVWVFPERRRAYGQALLQTLEYLTEKKPIVTSCATTMGRFLLHGRIEMMLNRTYDRSVSKVALFVILLIGTIILPVAMRPVYSSDGQNGRDAITPEIAARSYENYLKTIRSISFHSVFKDRISEKSDIYTNSLSQDYWIDFKGGRLRCITKRLDPKTGMAVAGPRAKVHEGLITPDKLYQTTADPNTFIAEVITGHLHVPDDYWKKHLRLLYLSYPFGYFQEGRQDRYIPELFQNMSAEEDGSSQVVLSCKTKEYELKMRLDRSKGWMANRIEYSRTVPSKIPSRPNYFLYAVDHASNHNGVWIPDSFHCKISKPGGKSKLPSDLRMVDGKLIIVQKGADIGVDFIEKEKSTLIAEVALSDIRIGALADSNFQLKTTVPDGMKVSMQDARQTKFKWLDGTVIPEN